MVKAKTSLGFRAEDKQMDIMIAQTKDGLILKIPNIVEKNIRSHYTIFTKDGKISTHVTNEDTHEHLNWQEINLNDFNDEMMLFANQIRNLFPPVEPTNEYVIAIKPEFLEENKDKMMRNKKGHKTIFELPQIFTKKSKENELLLMKKIVIIRMDALYRLGLQFASFKKNGQIKYVNVLSEKQVIIIDENISEIISTIMPDIVNPKYYFDHLDQTYDL